MFRKQKRTAKIYLYAKIFYWPDANKIFCSEKVQTAAFQCHHLWLFVLSLFLLHSAETPNTPVIPVALHTAMWKRWIPSITAITKSQATSRHDPASTTIHGGTRSRNSLQGQLDLRFAFYALPAAFAHSYQWVVPRARDQLITPCTTWIVLWAVVPISCRVDYNKLNSVVRQRPTSS